MKRIAYKGEITWSKNNGGRRLGDVVIEWKMVLNCVRGQRCDLNDFARQGPMLGAIKHGDEASVSIIAGLFLTSCITISFTRKAAACEMQGIQFARFSNSRYTIRLKEMIFCDVSWSECWNFEQKLNFHELQ
jgi:hypothetical protein